MNAPRHRDVSREFLGALPLPQASWRARSGWWLLLNLLRIPGAVQLLRRLRSRA
jgi:hypothetical protein